MTFEMKQLAEIPDVLQFVDMNYPENLQLTGVEFSYQDNCMFASRRIVGQPATAQY